MLNGRQNDKDNNGNRIMNKECEMIREVHTFVHWSKVKNVLLKMRKQLLIIYYKWNT